MVCDYEKPAVTADLVLFRIKDKKLQVALIKRTLQDVETGKWSLPGGFVDIDKTLEQTLYGKIADKIGFDNFTARQFTIRDNPARDNRWRVISCVYLGVTKEDGKCTWFTIDGNILRSENVTIEYNLLAFDHASMIREALDVLRKEMFYRDEIFKMTGDVFTLSSLKETCEAIAGHTIDNFTRKTKDIVEPTGEMLKGKRCRPAQYYRKKVSE